MVKDKEIVCKNCGWHWKLSDGGKDPYTCHKCGYNNKEMKLTEILKEMAKTDIHFQNIVSNFVNSDNHTKQNIAKYVSGSPHLDLDKLEDDLLHLDYDDVIEIENELGISNLDEKEKKGLWANIRAQRARGEKPARKGSKEFKQAVKAAKEINKATKK
jgi:DNA-directed RNA polymerase subunit RPC12/RpoP